MVETISVEDALSLRKKAIIDTRTPKEYAEDHLPGAINMPILENEERHEVGLTYKKSKQKAIEVAVEMFSKRLPWFMKEINKLAKNRQLVIYCWRGGMRSRTVVALLDAFGYKVYQLEGGYKSYRRYVMDALANFDAKDLPRFVVLYGLTGTGKTEIVRWFSDAIDLEGLAQHRSSLFGSIGLDPRNQKMFDSLLLQELKRVKGKKHVLIEGESKKIGKILIPDFLFSAMKKGINVRVEADVSSRVKVLCKDYGKALHEELLPILTRLKPRLSNTDIDELAVLIKKDDYKLVCRILLEKYYDPLYSHTVDNVRYDFSVDSNSISNAVMALKERFSLE